jgi:hypothetical protein
MLGKPGARADSIVLFLATSLVPGALAAQDVTAAAKAFSAGQQAELAREWDRAAEFYELADRIAPSPQALRSAAKSHLAAGDQAAAATQAEELLRRYPDDATSTALGAGILQQTTTRLSRWDIACSPACTIAIDAAAVATEPRPSHVLYSSPGDHRIEAFFSGNRSTTSNVTGTEGGRNDVAFEPPAAAALPKPDASAETPLDAHPAPAPETNASGLSPAITFVGVGITAVLGGVTLWSGLDTLGARDDYVAKPSQSGYDDGRTRERRTNLFIGATAVAGAATLGIALFATRWSSKEKDAPTPSASFPVTVAATAHDAEVVLRGSF